MTFLLDTRALLWWLADDDRIGPKARLLIEDPSNEVLVSVVSLWEIVVKIRVGKLQADIKEIIDAAQQEAFTHLQINTAHLLGLARLPLHHRDPFDHLLIAQAMVEDATFISPNQHLGKYLTQYINCSD